MFNRSHYEDVLIVRVHDLVPKSVWKARYDMINAFEQRLTANGTRVLKVVRAAGRPLAADARAVVLLAHQQRRAAPASERSVSDATIVFIDCMCLYMCVGECVYVCVCLFVCEFV